MSMKRYILMAVLAVGAASTVQAQEDLTKQLEVTRAYTPRVGQVEKLPTVPDMTDTVRLRPEITYRITSTASATSFTTRPFEAATIGVAPAGRARPLYLRAGVGLPLVSEVDLYYTPSLRAGRAFGIFANHSGSFSRIVNDLGHEADANEMTNGAGLWGSRQWRRYSLEADATYDVRTYNPYGVAEVEYNPASSQPESRAFLYDRRMHRFSLGLARAGVSFGDNFTDLSRFNFRFALDGGYAHRGNGRDQVNLDARLTAARMFGDGRHGFEAVVEERGRLPIAMPGATGANVVGSHVAHLVYGRDFSSDGLIDVAEVREGDPAPDGSGPLTLARGVEMGHIFQLGRKYAEALGLKVLDRNGKLVTVTMGSYGIGVTRAVAMVAEATCDDKGLAWPRALAPYDCVIVVAGKGAELMEAAEGLAADLELAGVDVVLDDRNVSPGVKFADSEMIGFPTSVVIGRGLKDGLVELRDRRSGSQESVPLGEALALITAQVRG